MNNFLKILDDIKSSAKAIKILQGNHSVQNGIAERYKINPESLLGLLLENTGGIIIDNWIRLYGTGEIDFASRNDFVPFDDLVIAEDISDLNCNEGVAFYPFLWAQAENLESRSRRIVPIDEIIRLEFDFLRQMDGPKSIEKQERNQS